MADYILYKNTLHQISKDKIDVFAARGIITNIDGAVWMFKPEATFSLEEAFWFSELSLPKSRERISILTESEFGDDE